MWLLFPCLEEVGDSGLHSVLQAGPIIPLRIIWLWSSIISDKLLSFCERTSKSNSFGPMLRQPISCPGLKTPKNRVESSSRWTPRHAIFQAHPLALTEPFPGRPSGEAREWGGGSRLSASALQSWRETPPSRTQSVMLLYIFAFRA